MEDRDRLAAIWCALLELDSVSDDDNFFAFGGDSLLAVELIEVVEAEFGCDPPVDALFADGSFGALVEAVTPRHSDARTQ
ncbi:phosphopantetheine-binding protein [Hamadaea sp.]|uniref:phosphopantetheine-binding protein n=1 Tax=Hamadaea sp. TaxID=2024425 RepID=UPI0025C4A985|nr:phosphopantetheine-binding protein [Hamadaea sp.]